MRAFQAYRFSVFAVLMWMTPLSLASSSEPTATFVATNEVFAARQAQPIESHQVVFQPGRIVDIPQDPKATIRIIDEVQNQITLIDPARKRRTQITANSLTQLVAKAQSEITDPDQRERYGMDAEVVTLGDGRYQIAFGQVRYNVTAESAPQPEMAIQLGQFTDSMCRLSLALPVQSPPFARMKLNQQLMESGLYAGELELQRGDQRLRSTTRLSTVMSAELKERLNQIAGMSLIYETVPWQEFSR